MLVTAPPVWYGYEMPTWSQNVAIAPHGPVEELAENLRVIEGDIPAMKMPLRRVMTVARMRDGRLVIHNGIALEEPVMAELERWGEPSFLLVPNAWHRIDAAAYKERYPRITVVCPEAARKKVEAVVKVDGTYSDFPVDPDVSVEHLDGVKKIEGFMKIRSSDGVSLAFCDAVFNQPHLPGFAGFLYRLFGSSGGPKVTRIFRIAAVDDKKALRAHLERLAAIPDLRRVIVMHGQRMSGPDQLLAAAATL